MDIRATQVELIKLLAETTDAGVLSQIAKILQPKSSGQSVWGYDTSGNLITEEMMMKFLEEAKADRAADRLTSHEDLEKEAENW